MRLIPAHAGKTFVECDGCVCGWAHPRSRGENYERKTGEPITSGSSPLTRGKRLGIRRGIRKRRLIPAHAGKTAASTSPRGMRPAHPRSRGENSAMIRPAPEMFGSSPLTRGKHRRRAGGRRSRGLIPAHAGKTPPGAGAPSSPTAHPRSRGENLWGVVAAYEVPGSSPLTRGKLRKRELSFPAQRLIPAHAGKTLPDLRFYCADRSDLGNP